MTSVFDGMAGVIADVFGAPVIYTPKGGEAIELVGLLREVPVEVATDNGGSVLMTAPTLQIQRDTAPDFSRGDAVALKSAPTDLFFIINRVPNGSPAADAMLIYELEKAV